MFSSVTLFSAFGWYGFLIGLGIVICIVVAYFAAKKRGYYSDLIFDVALFAVPFGIIGARTYFVLNQIIEYGTVWTFAEFLGFRDGKFVGLAGLAIYGGIIGGVIGVLVARMINKKKSADKQVTFIQMLDLLICVLILGQAIGRWGNFANQEAYGQLITQPQNWPWQGLPFMVFIESGYAGTGWYHACFFYEFAWNLIGFILLQWLYNGKRKFFDGFFIAAYMIWYGFIRFWVEGLRSDSMFFGAIKANQLISALIFFAGISIIVVHIILAKKKDKKPMLFVPEELLGPSYYTFDKSFYAKKAQK